MTTQELQKIVGARLRRLREAQGMKQGEFAKVIGISQQALGSYECGRRLPAAPFLLMLADHYNVSLDYLYGRDKEGCLGGPMAAVSVKEVEYIQSVINQVSSSIRHTENHLDTLRRFVTTLDITQGGVDNR